MKHIYSLFLIVSLPFFACGMKETSTSFSNLPVELQVVIYKKATKFSAWEKQPCRFFTPFIISCLRMFTIANNAPWKSLRNAMIKEVEMYIDSSIIDIAKSKVALDQYGITVPCASERSLQQNICVCALFTAMKFLYWSKHDVNRICYRWPCNKLSVFDSIYRISIQLDQNDTVHFHTHHQKPISLAVTPWFRLITHADLPFKKDKKQFDKQLQVETKKSLGNDFFNALKVKNILHEDINNREWILLQSIVQQYRPDQSDGSEHIAEHLA